MAVSGDQSQVRVRRLVVAVAVLLAVQMVFAGPAWAGDEEPVGVGDPLPDSRWRPDMDRAASTVRQLTGAPPGPGAPGRHRPCVALERVELLAAGTDIPV